VKLHSTCRPIVPTEVACDGSFPLPPASILPWGGLPKWKADTTEVQQQKNIATLGEMKAPHE